MQIPKVYCGWGARTSERSTLTGVRDARAPGSGQEVPHFSAGSQLSGGRRARAPSAEPGPGCIARLRLHSAALQGASLHALAAAEPANCLLPAPTPPGVRSSTWQPPRTGDPQHLAALLSPLLSIPSQDRTQHPPLPVRDSCAFKKLDAARGGRGRRELKRGRCRATLIGPRPGRWPRAPAQCAVARAAGRRARGC